MQFRALRERQENSKIKTLADGALDQMASMLPQERAIGIGYFEDTLSFSNIIGHLNSSWNVNCANLNVLETLADLPADTRESRLLVARLNEAFKATPIWQDLKTKNTITQSLSKAQNGHRIAPVKLFSKNFGFSIVAENETKGGKPLLMLRVPDDIHLSASPDMAKVIEEVKNQLALTAGKSAGRA